MSNASRKKLNRVSQIGFCCPTLSVKREVGDGWREGVHRMIELAAKAQVGESGRELRYGMIETEAKSEMSNAGRKVIYRLIKIGTKYKVSNMGREGVQGMVERGVGVCSCHYLPSIIDGFEKSTSTEGEVGEGEGEIVYSMAEVVSKD